MSTLATLRLLAERKIVGLEMRPRPDGRGGTMHDPKITLDNGAVLYCVVEETDVGEYGIALMYAKPSR